LAIAIAYLLSRLPQLGARRLAGQAVGRAFVYAQGVAVIALLVFYSDRVEASPGPGETPLESLFRAMNEKGVPIPPGLRERIQSDPELRRLATEAVATGDISKAQEELNKKMLQVIADNPDAFSQEDLEVLLSTSSKSGGPESASDPSLETIRAAIDAKKRGEPIGEIVRRGSGAGSGEGTTPDPQRPGPGGGEGPAEEGGQPASGLTEDGRRELRAASAPARALWAAMVGPASGGPTADDAALRRFLAALPSDLRADEAQQLVQRVGPAGGKTLDEILASLETAIQSMRNPRPSPDATTEPDVQPPTTEVSPEAEGEGVAPDEYVERMLEIIHTYGGWGNVTRNTQIVYCADPRGYAKIPIGAEADAIVFNKEATPNGGMIRGAATARIRIRGRSRRNGRLSIAITFVRCSEFVFENRRRAPTTIRPGRQASVDVIDEAVAP
jgi:hypothetical protein